MWPNPLLSSLIDIFNNKKVKGKTGAMFKRKKKQKQGRRVSVALG